ncbi:MAG: hypothetical protein R2762_10125 [Bryobacteraceae bacterium]
MNQQIREAAELFRDSPVLGDDELFEMLVLRGVERMLAARLVEFLPMVYCRILLRDGGATFPDVYYRIAGDGSKVRHELSDDRVWNAAMEHAQREVEQGRGEAAIRLIAQRGAEYRAAAQLLEGGSALENIAFAPMIFKWPEQGPPDVAVNEPKKPKWWPFGTSR